MSFFTWPPVQLSLSPAELDLVDVMDAGIMLDTSSTNIPASGGAALSVVASLASEAKKVRSQDDIGEFISLFVDGVETLVLGPGGSEIECSIPAGSAISLKNKANVAISSGKLLLYFLG